MCIRKTPGCQTVFLVGLGRKDDAPRADTARITATARRAQMMKVKISALVLSIDHFQIPT